MRKSSLTHSTLEANPFKCTQEVACNLISSKEFWKKKLVVCIYMHYYRCNDTLLVSLSQTNNEFLMLVKKTHIALHSGMFPIRNRWDEGRKLLNNVEQCAHITVLHYAHEAEKNRVVNSQKENFSFCTHKALVFIFDSFCVRQRRQSENIWKRSCIHPKYYT